MHQNTPLADALDQIRKLEPCGPARQWLESLAHKNPKVTVGDAYLSCTEAGWLVWLLYRGGAPTSEVSLFLLSWYANLDLTPEDRQKLSAWCDLVKKRETSAERLSQLEVSNFSWLQRFTLEPTAVGAQAPVVALFWRIQVRTGKPVTEVERMFIDALYKRFPVEQVYFDLK